MLIAGSTDGVYRLADVRGSGKPTVETVLDVDEVFRVRQFDALEGLFVTAESGLYYSANGDEWTALSVPEDQIYAVTASPSDGKLYAGTRPAGLFVADGESGLPTDESDWEAVPGFREMRARSDWGIPRHDGLAQVRSLCTHSDAPDRIVAGIEVGGVHVSDDRGETWTDRRIDGFDAPHADDVYHVALADGETLVASTGSGLYRSTDTGRSWERLDTGHRQRYFREAFVHGGTVYAGGAPRSSSSWESKTDHALFECHDGRTLERVSSPVADEVVVGWCAVGDDVMAATHRGTLLRRRPAGWRAVGSVPVPDGELARYLPLTWYEP
jgi:hypothetical protein